MLLSIIFFITINFGIVLKNRYARRSFAHVNDGPFAIGLFFVMSKIKQCVNIFFLFDREFGTIVIIYLHTCLIDYVNSRSLTV